MSVNPDGNILNSQQPASDEWVSIQEAARRLGASPMTVRRRIRKGTIEAELQPGRGHGEYRVRVPREYSSAPSESVQEATQATLELIRLIGLQRDEVSGLQSELRRLTGEAAATSARAELLEAEVERMRAELERMRRPWWRKMFGG